MIEDYTVQATTLCRYFPKLPVQNNKGKMGRVLAVCGSYDPHGLSMSGAAYFAASAAYRTGAGVVEIFTPSENYMPLASRIPEAVFSLYGCDEGEEEVVKRLKTALSNADAVVIGCGLGKSTVATALVRFVLQNCAVPLIMDADGLNILAEHTEWWSLLSDQQKGQTVVTPHPGEMARLCRCSIAEIMADIPGNAKAFAKKRGVICLLKDHNTAISDGERIYINQSGNPGMATGGMGDLLAGILGSMAARVCCGGDLCELVAAGTYLHGLAGDHAASKIGAYGLLAGDLLTEIPFAISDIFDKL